MSVAYILRCLYITFRLPRHWHSAAYGSTFCGRPSRTKTKIDRQYVWPKNSKSDRFSTRGEFCWCLFASFMFVIFVVLVTCGWRSRDSCEI